jgi:hypothetical protein
VRGNAPNFKEDVKDRDTIRAELAVGAFLRVLYGEAQDTRGLHVSWDWSCPGLGRRPWHVDAKCDTQMDGTGNIVFEERNVYRVTGHVEPKWGRDPLLHELAVVSPHTWECSFIDMVLFRQVADSHKWAARQVPNERGGFDTDILLVPRFALDQAQAISRVTNLSKFV